MTTGAIAIALVLSICLVVALSTWTHRVNRRMQRERRRVWDDRRDGN